MHTFSVSHEGLFRDGCRKIGKGVEDELLGGGERTDAETGGCLLHSEVVQEDVLVYLHRVVDSSRRWEGGRRDEGVIALIIKQL